jgi:hypothetical protein
VDEIRRKLDEVVGAYNAAIAARDRQPRPDLDAAAAALRRAAALIRELEDLRRSATYSLQYAAEEGRLAGTIMHRVAGQLARSP